jgi:hypothetical protein
MSEGVSKDSSRLVNAAEELIKAACIQTETASFAQLNTVNQSILNLKEEVVGLKNDLANLAKNEKLQWAITNAALNAFEYYEKDTYRKIESTSVVRSILFSFSQGVGHYITNRSMTHYNNAKMEEGEKQFRDALSKSIHQLLGQKPRIALADSGYAIYYS